MIVNQLPLPRQFVEMVNSRKFRRSIGSWQLIEERDSYGNLLETELGEVYCTTQAIRKETNELPVHFQPDGYYAEPTEEMAGPGAIPDIVDFSRILKFGLSGDGAPFCFDYRDSDKPSVIWWDDVYWRRVSPDFVDLFDFAIEKWDE